MHIFYHFTLQYYLTKAIPIKRKKQIRRLRLPAHNLVIKHGRHTNDHNSKLCHLDTEDEFYFVLKCPHFHDIRCKYRKKYFWGKNFSF